MASKSNSNSIFSNIISDIWLFVSKRWTNKKLVIFILICGFPLFIVPSSWQYLINSYWVNPIVSNLNYDSVLFLTCFVLILIVESYLNFIKIYWVNFVVLIWILISFTNTNHNWVFSYWSLSYFGTFTVYSIYKIIPDWKHFINSNSISNQLVPDEFERTNLAKNVLKFINKTDINESFNFGIIGSWGSGKTFFSKLIKQQIEVEPNIIKPVLVVDFIPWELADQNQFLLCLLKTIRSELSKEISIRHAIDQLILLTQQDNPSYPFKIISYLYQIFIPLESLNDIKQKLNQELENKKLIIFLDDMDRLKKEEILMLFKILRNNLNLRNTFFIVGFDRDYLKAELGIDRFDEYCEKFFQIRIDLPVFRNIKQKLAEYLISKINGFDLPNEFIQELIQPNYSFKIPFIEYDTIFEEVKNLRDVEQISNNFFLIANSIRKFNCDLMTLLKLEILRYKFPEAYKSMALKKEIILRYYTHPSKGTQILTVHAEPESEVEIKSILGVSEKELHIISEIMDRNANHQYPINSKAFYDIYFKYNVVLEQIDQTEFESIFLANANDVELKIADWFEHNKGNDLVQIKMKAFLKNPKKSFSKNLKTVFTSILKHDLEYTDGEDFLIGEYGELLNDEILKSKGVIDPEVFRENIFQEFDGVEKAKILFTFGKVEKYKSEILEIIRIYIKDNKNILDSNLRSLTFWYLSHNVNTDAQSRLAPFLKQALEQDSVGFLKCFLMTFSYNRDRFYIYNDIIPNWFSPEEVIELLNKSSGVESDQLKQFLIKIQENQFGQTNIGQNISKSIPIQFNFEGFVFY